MLQQMYKRILTLSILPFLGLIIYSNTIQAPFVFDDGINIVENQSIRDLGGFWPPSGSRYLGILSFALNYHFHGLDVSGYHLVNIVIHILNAILVYWLLSLTIQLPLFKWSGSKIFLFPFLSAVIFLVHPVQTQAVTYIIQRFTSLAAFFYLMAVIFYIKARIWNGRTILLLSYYALSLTFTVMAMKTKEISFTLPLIIALYEFTFFRSTTFRSLRGRLLYLLPFLATMLIIPLGMVHIGRPLGELIGELSRASAETSVMPISRQDYLLTQFRVIVTYLRLLFLPINQNLDYDYPISYSLFEPQTLISMISLISIFAVAIYLFKRSLKTDNVYGVLAYFGILWFFITLSVESSIIPISDVIFEHRLYLPSVGVIISLHAALFYLLEKIWEGRQWQTLIIFYLIIITPVLSTAAYLRNAVWKDNRTLWADVVKKSPNKARPHNNLGNAYARLNLIGSAEEEYKSAIRLDPDFADAHKNMGDIYRFKGELEKAVLEYSIAVKLKPDLPEVYLQLGNIYLEQQRWDKAINEFRTAIILRPDYPIAHFNTGIAYARMGSMESAIQGFRNAIILKPDYAEAHLNLGSVYGQMGMADEAIKEFKTALEINPGMEEARNNLAIAYRQREGLK